jgi:arginyl-tRNA synthetase
MKNYKAIIADTITNVAATAFQGADISKEEIYSLLEYPADTSMGDIALPCFKLSKVLRRSPVQIAATLAEEFGDNEIINAVAVNGYLNFKIDSTALANNTLNEVFTKGERYGSPECGEGKTIVLDYSSPNVAKPFHIGHLGTTVIGHSIKMLYEFAGYKCIGVNHLGDWGTQFGKLIVAYRKWGCKEDIENGGIDKLVELYVKFHAEAENDPTLEDRARAEFTALEAGNAENLELWKWFIGISIEEYKKTYDQLGIEFDSYAGESFYYDKCGPVLDKLKDSGITKLDAGATIVDLAEYNMPPCLVLKSDGSTIYATRDIAAALYRKETYDFDKCIYVTSAGQSLHFAQWFKVVELMGYDWADKLVHVPYGTVSINGAKLATRTGNVILLKDLFAQAVDKVYQITGEKNPDMTEEKKNEIAEKVGVGAIVFYYLSNNRIKDINFMLEDALSYDGNTGPYVQYTYARTCSVLSKASGVNQIGEYFASTPEEHELLRVISIFPERIQAAIDNYEPFYVTRYILDLAAAFNRFYHNCGILTETDPRVVRTRVALTAATKSILGKSFELICMKKTEQI